MVETECRTQDVDYEALRESGIMEKKRYIHWQDGGVWLGYLEEYPDYMTQGKTIEELEENLRDIYVELTSGNIPCVRKVAELEIV